MPSPLVAITRVGVLKMLARPLSGAYDSYVVETGVRQRCWAGVSLFVVAVLVALATSESASAKFKISIRASDRTPAAETRFTLLVTSERPLDFDLRLIAVAPGRPVFPVVATITGDTSRPMSNVARHGFEITLTRIAPNRWQGAARLNRRGVWRLVVPNGAPVGVIVPNGAALLSLPVH